MITYRLANKNDIPNLMEMRWLFKTENKDKDQFNQEEFYGVLRPFLQYGLDKEWFVWIAEEEGQILSNLYIQRIEKMPKPNYSNRMLGYITNVFTKEDYRNKGIGKELLDKAKAWAAEEGYEALFLWPSEKAVPYYVREDFTFDNEIMEWKCKL